MKSEWISSMFLSFSLSLLVVEQCSTGHWSHGFTETGASVNVSYRNLEKTFLKELDEYSDLGKRAEAVLDRRQKPEKETIILITNDGPTLLGTKTNFNVTITSPVKGTIYLSYYTFTPHRRFEFETTLRFYRFSIKSWLTTGTKLVYVRVKQKDSFGRIVTLATNYTSVEVSERVYCNVQVWQNGSRVLNNSVNLGNVSFTVTFHDPNKFLQDGNVSTVWSFSDGSPLVPSYTASVIHLFRKEGSFKVQVLAFILVGGKKYIGNGQISIKVVSRVKYELVVWQGLRREDEPRVPSRDQCVAIGASFFLIQIMDPFHILRNAKISYHWKFDDGRGNISRVNFSKHIFDTVGHKTVTVDVVARVKNRVHSSVVEKVILVQDPIHSIIISGKEKADKGELVMFNVTCQGSPPVSFCWYITEGGCQLPQNVICSPTVIYKSCWSVFYHKFRYSGRFCVNVSVINTVSFVHQQMQVHVEGIPEAEKGHIVAIASTLPFVAVFLLIITVFLAIKHTKGMYYRKNKKRSETAKFDFRGSNPSFDHWSSSGRCNQPYGCPARPGCSWPCLRVEEDDVDDVEEQALFSDPSSPATPQRKTSYYGTIHMNLLQQKHNDPVKEDDPMARENSLCHSV